MIAHTYSTKKTTVAPHWLARTALIGALALLQACGDGGGGGSDGSSSSSSSVSSAPYRLTFSPTELAATTTEGTAQTVDVTVTSDRPITEAFDVEVLVPGVLDPAVQSAVALSPTSYRVTVHTASTLGVGTYRGSLQIKLCRNRSAGCTSTLPGSPFTLPYRLTVNAAPPAPPAPPGALTYYFSDCQTGSSPGCVVGNNANTGASSAVPKQNLSGININTLPAGSQLLFARGGSWNWSPTVLENMNTTAAAPLVFDAYGSGPLPGFSQSSGNMFHLGGNWNNTSNDGGYTFRNIKFDGRGTATWGFWFVHTVRDVVIENSEITGFAIGINSNDTDAHTVRGITLRNNNIHHNHDMGMLGHYSDLLIEGNLIEANNFTGSGFSHGTYLGGGENITIRNNRYIRNSVVSGVCQGGNMTFHGQIDGLLIEGNSIEQDAAAAGCWLISITQGYTTAEWFRNTVVRNNKLINGGNTGMAAQSAPGIVVEGNVIINTQTTAQTALSLGHTEFTNGDVPDGNAIVRNNTACYPTPHINSAVVRVISPSSTVSNNVMLTGAAATTGVCAP